MAAQQVNPWRIAIEGWLDRIERGDHCAAFRDAWMRLGRFSTADLELKPLDSGPHNEWLILGLKVASFGKDIGTFGCAIRNASLEDSSHVVIASPSFSDKFPDDLQLATLGCLYRLAPEKSTLEVLIEDVVESPTSTLGSAGIYTEAGWGLNPANTELISEFPRRWIFRFSKN